MRGGVRQYLVAGVIVAMAGGLAACGGSGPASPTTTATAATGASTTSPGTATTASTPGTAHATAAVVAVCQDAAAEGTAGQQGVPVTTVQKALGEGGAKFSTDVQAWLLDTTTAKRDTDAKVVVQDCKQIGGLPSS